MAIIEARKEALQIAQFLAALGYRLSGQPVNLRADNREAILLIANLKFHQYIKYIEV